MSMTSVFFSKNSSLPLPFLLMGAYMISSFSTLSFFVYDLVKGLQTLASTTTVGEGKSKLLPFVHVTLFYGVFVETRAILGERSICGE
jgi:hypothetical protein